MRRFTSDAAHELRSPIAVLQTQAEVTLRHPRSTEEYRMAIEVTHAETKRLGKMVEQLLSLSRHDAGIVDETMEDVPIKAVARDVVARFEVLAKERDVRLEIAALPELQIHGHDIWVSRRETSQITNKDGVFQFKGLAAGNNRFAEIVQAVWVPTDAYASKSVFHFRILSIVLG